MMFLNESSLKICVCVCAKFLKETTMSLNDQKKLLSHMQYFVLNFATN